MQSGIILAAFKSPALNVNDNTGNEKLSLDQRMKLAEKEQHEKWNRTDIAISPHLLSSQDAPQLQLTLHSGRINTACSEQPKNNCLATPASGSEKNIAASHRQAQSLPSQQRQMAKDAIAKSAVTGQRLAPAGSRENIDRISLSSVGKSTVSREIKVGEGHPMSCGKQTLTPAGTGNYADMSDKKRVVEADLHETTRTKAKEKQEEKAVYHAMRPAAPEWHSTDSAEETLSEMQKPSETVKAIRDAYLQIRSTADQGTEILWRFNIKNSNADHSARVVITHGNYGNNAVYAITPSNRQVQRMLEQHKSQKEVVITPADKRLCQERSRDDYFDETEDR
ncbi:MAG: hypothetical protein QRY16_14520 [Enterobacterales bacterium endosymbiont of Blomia tropicalis]|uniref:hypothetical protein n=1 Tax=Mixta mediterraneensis TaxID=2758443 RepID=UPI0025A930BF|nr:hypothetical protein [Mixta mediterraneensis]MDL4914954.1 hypothetical protein [Mixta mediterraneensis]